MNSVVPYLQLFEKYCHIYLFNALHTTRTIFFVTSNSGTPTGKDAFLSNILMLKNTAFASLITLGGGVHAIESANVITINC